MMTSQQGNSGEQDVEHAVARENPMEQTQGRASDACPIARPGVALRSRRAT